MKGAIHSGLRQAWNIRTLLVPVMTVAVMLVCSIDPVLRTDRGGGGFYAGFHSVLLLQTIQSDALAAFLPILAALPFSASFVEDVQSKFARYFLIRSTYRRYAVSRVAVAFLTGGLAVTLGILLFWGASAAVLIPLEEPSTLMEAPSRQIGEMLLLIFLNGGLGSVVGLSLSTLMESKYIAYCSPFVLYYLLVILYERYFGELFLIYPRNWVKPELWPHGCWGAGIFLLAITLIFALLFTFRAGRRLRQL